MIGDAARYAARCPGPWEVVFDQGHPFEEQAARLGSAGLEFYLCPGTSSWQSLVGRVPNLRANLSEAARTASVPVSTAYFWLHNDQDFKDQYWIADRIYGDSVRSIIRKRIEDPTGNRGSDALVMFEAKGRFPEIYRETAPPVKDLGQKDALCLDLSQ